MPFTHLLTRLPKIDDNIYYSFREKGAFYSSLKVTENFLITNNVPRHLIKLCEVYENNYDLNTAMNADLIISLLSWGFHYPVDTYLNTVLKILKNNGRLIIDIRKRTGDYEKINKQFKSLNIISESIKKYRLCFTK
ncbi:MAG: hypothetical protein A2163_08170 [Actinobacteria bacterium RBG_13_35_12]|nr:MAG: hypothetical protein A2163_08170 [Actinobacteria bacterium RBG_13_35_12]